MENSLGLPSCIAIEIEIELEPYEEKKIVLMLGEEDEKHEIYDVIEKFKKEELASNSLRETRDYWNNLLRKVQVRTGDEMTDFMLNRLDNVPDHCMQNVCKKCILSVRRSIWV